MTITAERTNALNAARNLLKRVYAILGVEYDRFVNANEEVDDRVAIATGKVEAALNDFDGVRFGSHRYENQGMADAIACHQYRDDAQHGGHFIPDANRDHFGNLAARAILSAMTLVETAEDQ